MRYYRRAICALCALICALTVLAWIQAVAAQQDVTRVRLGGDNLRERVTSQVPISGGVRVGLMVETGKPASDTEIFTAFLPKLSEGRWLCLEFLSIDGRYEASGELSLRPEQTGKPVIVELDSNYRDVLDEYAPRDVAIIAALKENCGSAKTKSFVVSQWGDVTHIEGKSKYDKIHVLLNSNRADMYLRFLRGKDRKKLSCTPIDGKTRTAFDVVCEIPLSRMLDLRNTKIGGRRGTTGIKPLELPVVGWCGDRPCYEE